MAKFLDVIAKQLLGEYGDKLTGHRLVFPNRRSAVYFRYYLSSHLQKAVLPPPMLTISEMFGNMSDLRLADNLELSLILYEAYCGLKNNAEPFDEFFYWGEMILNDFDDIDKYLVNSRDVFSNLKDISEIDAKFGMLDSRVLDIIKQFWINFKPEDLTPEKRDFISLWDILSSLYENFRQKLIERSCAYEGMIMRNLAENIKNGESVFDEDGFTYHFIGFNALNNCEKRLFDYLKSRRKAKFYWDYDSVYLNMPEHEAGLFIRSNIERYGQDIKGIIRFDNLRDKELSEGKWKVYKAPSDVAQAKLIPGIIEEAGDRAERPDKTAIVLADENMLMPVINSIPSHISDINITMGYPLFQTPVYSLVHQLLSLQKNKRKDDKGNTNFYHLDVLKILNHQYVAGRGEDEISELSRLIKSQNMIRVDSKMLDISMITRLLFSDHDGAGALNAYILSILHAMLEGFATSGDDAGDDEPGNNNSGTFDLQQEYLFTLIRSLKRLDTIFAASPVSIGPDVYTRLVDRVMRKLIIPFSGEPLRGIQVMGILETRALDFDNIIVLSVNEGILPRASAGNTYIPYNLRMAFGLPTIKHQDSIYAYYFYRLVQRAGRVFFIYNSSASGLRTGEMSRFLLQLKYDKRNDIGYTDARFNILPPPVAAESLKRSEPVQSYLIKQYSLEEKGRLLSPSALNTWINCRMQFYYRYIAGLKEQETVTEEIDSRMFGTILHDVMNNLYHDYLGGLISSDALRNLSGDRARLRDVIESAFRKAFMHNRPGKITGKNIIIVSVIEKMVLQILSVDERLAPFEVKGLEEYFSTDIDIAVEEKYISFRIGGIIDRVDRKDGVTRILDYKSGKDSLEVETLESLTGYNVKNRNSAAFQTLVYSDVYEGKTGGREALRPALYPVRAIYNDSFSDVFRIKNGEYKGDITDYNALRPAFREALSGVLSDIFDPSFDFDMTERTENCSFCPFRILCDRQDAG